MFSGLPEEDATGERNNSGYSFKGDAVKASSKNRLGAPAAAGAWSPGGGLGS